MSGSTRPKKILGSPGSRVRVILGATGSEFLCLVDEQEDDEKWQSCDWNSIPLGLSKQLTNILEKGRHVTAVEFDLEERWYVSARRRQEGNKNRSWTGGCEDDVVEVIKEWEKECENDVDVRLGHEGEWLLLQKMSRGYWGSPFLDSDLTRRLKRNYEQEKRIHNMQFFPNGGYFLLDDDGPEYSMTDAALSKELDQTSETPLDVVMAGDGSWLILWDNHIASSDGISETLLNSIRQFYAAHRRRQNARNREIQQYDAMKIREQRKIAAERAKREAEEKAIREMESKRKQEQALREQQTKSARKDLALRDAMSRKNLKEGDRVAVVGLSEAAGDVVIRSVADGQITVMDVHPLDGSNNGIEQSVDPDRVVTIQPREEEDEETISRLCYAADKFEAALSLYRARGDGRRTEQQSSSSSSLSLSSSTKRDVPKATSVTPEDPPAFLMKKWKTGDRVEVIGHGDATITATAANLKMQRLCVRYDDGTTELVQKSKVRPIPTGSPTPPQTAAAAEEKDAASVKSRQSEDAEEKITAPASEEEMYRPLLEHRGEKIPFDEYVCAEKVDLEALRKVVSDLERDTAERDACMKGLKSMKSRTKLEDLALHKLRRCHVLERTARDLLDVLKDMPTDDFGNAVYEVDYEQRDASHRGRLFARGRPVSVKHKRSDGERYVRTATLQGMPRDLRIPLVGKYCYEFDCENSDVRLLCSLATQYGWESLVPTLQDYRDNRPKWLDLISSLHSVSLSESKRLPSIILSGGRYEMWLCAMEEQQSSTDFHWPTSGTHRRRELKQFLFRLSIEVRALRDQLLKHPRFQWTRLDRMKLKEGGKTEKSIPNLLLSLIVQACENEVLGIIHRCFEESHWKVRAKVFDSLIAEPVRGRQATPSVVVSRKRNVAEVVLEAQQTCRSLGWDVKLAEKRLHGLEEQSIPAIKDARESMRGLNLPSPSSSSSSGSSSGGASAATPATAVCTTPSSSPLPARSSSFTPPPRSAVDTPPPLLPSASSRSGATPPPVVCASASSSTSPLLPPRTCSPKVPGGERNLHHNHNHSPIANANGSPLAVKPARSVPSPPTGERHLHHNHNHGHSHSHSNNGSPLTLKPVVRSVPSSPNGERHHPHHHHNSSSNIHHSNHGSPLALKVARSVPSSPNNERNHNSHSSGGSPITLRPVRYAPSPPSPQSRGTNGPHPHYQHSHQQQHHHHNEKRHSSSSSPRSIMHLSKRERKAPQC